MIEILCEKYSDKQYTGLDLTPEMIKKAKGKGKDKCFLKKYLKNFKKTIDTLYSFWYSINCRNNK